MGWLYPYSFVTLDSSLSFVIQSIINFPKFPFPFQFQHYICILSTSRVWFSICSFDNFSCCGLYRHFLCSLFLLSALTRVDNRKKLYYSVGYLLSFILFLVEILFIKRLIVSSCSSLSGEQIPLHFTAWSVTLFIALSSSGSNRSILAAAANDDDDDDVRSIGSSFELVITIAVVINNGCDSWNLGAEIKGVFECWLPVFGLVNTILVGLCELAAWLTS